jgi:hypothetical protein
MKRFLIALTVSTMCFNWTGEAHARPRRQYQQSQPIQNAVRAMANTAQGVAEACANRGVLAHMGGNSGPEGLGMGSTPESAYRNCCFANSGMPDADVGYAQGANGMWYCCRRYGGR